MIENINIIKDSDIAEVAITKGETTKNFSIIDLNPQKKFAHEIVITPHYWENYGNIVFWKLKTYCERNNIKLIAFGLLNQLPLFSTFADKMILQNKENMSEIYRGGSMIGADKEYIKYLTDAEYTEVKTVWYKHIVVMNPPARPTRQYKLLQKRLPYYTSAAREVSDEEVAEKFTNLNTSIRQSSFDMFQKMRLPKNVIVCEFKTSVLGHQRFHLFPVHKWILRNKENFALPLVGLNKVLQKKILSECGNHYMSIQILASLFNNWQYMCQGGSANLMCMLPVKSIMFNEQWINPCRSVKNTIRLIYQNRYGEIGTKIPTICPIEEINKRPENLLNTINLGIEKISNIEIPALAKLSMTSLPWQTELANR